MRVAVTSISAGAGSTTLPAFSLYSPAGQGFILREIGIFNTTTTAARYKLCRLNATGTQGSGLTETKLLQEGPTPVVTAFAAHSGGTPIGGGDIAALPVGAAIGAGTILTFYGEGAGIAVASGTTNGIGLAVASGTGQVCDIYAIWDE